MKAAILSLSQSLITHKSTSSNPQTLRSILECAVQSFRDRKDVTIEHFERNNKPSVLVYRGKSRPKKFKLILNAHLDVVSGKEEQFVPYEQDGKLYGRGAIDMKAAAAVEILIFKEFVDKISSPIGLQLVTDEETGGFDGTKYQIERGVRADFVIAGEPTDFGVNNKAKGIIWIKVKTKGVSAHGAYPWQGSNALLRAQAVLQRLYSYYPLPKKESWQTTMNLAKIETPNQTFNKVPDEATLWFDIRYIPEELNKRSFESGKKFLEKKIRKIIGKLGEIEILLFEPPQITYHNNPFILNLKKSIAKVTGKTAKTIVKHGGSDIRHFNAVGCEGVTFGPIGGNLHGDDEWVDIESLHNYYLILKEFLSNLNRIS